MNVIRPIFVIIIVAAIPTVIMPQTSSEEKAGFSLTLSEGRRDASMVSWQSKLIVKMTNISKEPIVLDSCSAGGALYRLHAVFNGVLEDEGNAERKHREDIETAETNGGLCFGASNFSYIIQPGKFWDDTLYYNTAKPEIYDFVVERKTFPRDSRPGIVVKSNIVTIIMPELKAKKPEEK